MEFGNLGEKSQVDAVQLQSLPTQATAKLSAAPVTHTSSDAATVVTCTGVGHLEISCLAPDWPTPDVISFSKGSVPNPKDLGACFTKKLASWVSQCGP